MSKCPHLPEELLKRFDSQKFPIDTKFLIRTAQPIHASNPNHVIDETARTYVMWQARWRDVYWRSSKETNLEAKEFDAIASTVLENFYLMARKGLVMTERSPYVTYTASTLTDVIEKRNKSVYSLYDPDGNNRASFAGKVGFQIHRLSLLAFLVEAQQENSVSVYMGKSSKPKIITVTGGYRMPSVNEYWFIDLNRKSKS